MGLLDFLKKPKYGYTEEEVREKIRTASVITNKSVLEELMEEAKTPRFPQTQLPTKRRKRPLVPLAPGEKCEFVVSDSFTLVPFFIVKGSVVSGAIVKGMVSVYKGEQIVVKGLQEGLSKSSRLLKGDKGSLEVETSPGLDLPPGTVLEFRRKKDLARPKKRRRKARKKSAASLARETEITKAIPKKLILESPDVIQSQDLNSNPSPASD